jgi:hypothetical protein
VGIGQHAVDHLVAEQAIGQHCHGTSVWVWRLCHYCQRQFNGYVSVPYFDGNEKLRCVE